MKNKIDMMKRWLDIAEEKICELEDIAIEAFQNSTKREKRIERNLMQHQCPVGQLRQQMDFLKEWRAWTEK